jgi:beta-galactosidase GanA
MKRFIRLVATTLVLAAFGVSASAQQSRRPVAQLEQRGKVWQLIVDGKPYFARAGELNNSSSSSSAFMEDVWPKLVKANVNTVLAVVAWDIVEPEEGRYDFATVDALIAGARAHRMRLVPLWFGSWKNGASHYAPYWVKSDQKRFPLVRTVNGNIDTLSASSVEARNADARAFAALMRHIKEVDSAERTVIMVQVENEVGVVGDARDRSDGANAAFAAPVPATLTHYLTARADKLIPETLDAWRGAGAKTSGSWADVFGGTRAEEYFQAWQYATYIDHVTAAGKAEYALPMFVNAWLPSERSGLVPGAYPSGGPVPHTQDIWRAGAPALDFLAPDIYVTNFAEVLARYNRAGNPLFVPEARPELEGAANAAYAASKGAFGYSPFGIESRIADYDKGPITKVYALLRDLEPLLFEQQAAGTINGVIVDKDHVEERIVMGDYALIVGLVQDRNTPAYLAERGYAMVMMTGKDEFTIAGYGIQVSFATPVPTGQVVALGPVEEGVLRAGKWIAGRRLNGDEVVLNRNFQKRSLENQSGTGLRFLGDVPEIQKVRLYRYTR